MKRAGIAAGVALFIALTAAACGLQQQPPPVSDTSPPPQPVAAATVQAEVISVTDGDTFRVWYKGVNEPVRVLGIDTPELPDECWAQQAASTARGVLRTGNTVTLIPDEAQGDRDRYGRLLRIVILPNGADFAQFTVRNGTARVYQQYPMSRTPDYLKAQDKARTDNGGIGGWKVCGWTP